MLSQNGKQASIDAVKTIEDYAIILYGEKPAIGINKINAEEVLIPILDYTDARQTYNLIGKLSDIEQLLSTQVAYANQKYSKCFTCGFMFHKAGDSNYGECRRINNGRKIARQAMVDWDRLNAYYDGGYGECVGYVLNRSVLDQLKPLAKKNKEWYNPSMKRQSYTQVPFDTFGGTPEDRAYNTIRDLFVANGNSLSVSDFNDWMNSSKFDSSAMKSAFNDLKSENYVSESGGMYKWGSKTAGIVETKPEWVKTIGGLQRAGFGQYEYQRQMEIIYPDLYKVPGEYESFILQLLDVRPDFFPIRASKVSAMNAKTNDLFRQTLGLGGRSVMTQGVSMMDSRDQSELMEAVMKFKTFNGDNDPYGEHDFGKVTVKGTDYFWKIDDYVGDGRPSSLVLTIMRADEY